MKKSIFCQVMAIAIKKLNNHPEIKNFIHFSFIIQDNKIVEWGRNNKAIPARHYGYHQRIDDPNFGPKTHSEVDAYKKAKGLLNKNKPFEIINIRLNKNYKIRNSKPCECCYALLKELGCSKFYYSDDNLIPLNYAGFRKI